MICCKGKKHATSFLFHLKKKVTVSHAADGIQSTCHTVNLSLENFGRVTVIVDVIHTDSYLPNTKPITNPYLNLDT